MMDLMDDHRLAALPDTGSITTDPGYYTEFVLPFCLEARSAGLACALLTLVRADGPSPRPVGAQMAVCEDGRSIGLISGGCLERTLVRDALAAMSEGRNRLERYGKGSRFIDIRMPCGGGIDIYFDVNLSDAHVATLVRARKARFPVHLALPVDRPQTATRIGPGAATGVRSGVFHRNYLPACRILVIGDGPILRPLHLFGAALEIETSFGQYLTAKGGLIGTGQQTVSRSNIDPYTACVLLFHDHSGEAEVLKELLLTEAFYIGALGSRATHGRRIEQLKAMGMSDRQSNRICGPIGTAIGAATPPEIALAIAAQIVEFWRRDVIQ